MKRCTAAEPDPQPVERPYRATFIVRMWREKDRLDGDGWRGVVEHAQSGERRAVAGAGGLVELLTAWLSEEPDVGT